ncbi:NAD-dependent epimerase/dehydratase family protein [Pseudomonas palmensis]|uniref:NAD-dependent epimerase/dehydratase family protein n=1 Tax=Pseudomonas palmensis TaxID=2815362 RepID=UPI0039ED58E1
MNTILVTGAGGFVGRMLCQALVNQGYATRGLVRAMGVQVEGVEYYPVDLVHDDVPFKSLTCVSCVVHLAGRAHVLKDQEQDPLSSFRLVNCEATLKLARQALEAGVKRFIFMSSIGVNGSHTDSEPFDEMAEPHPHADYARSKFEAEEKLKLLLAGTTMELVIVRPPLIYGLEAPGNFARLLKLVASGAPLPLRSIRNARSLVSIENVVSFLIRCIDHSEAAGQLFLIADGEDVSTSQIVEQLALGMDRRARLISVPAPILQAGLALLGRKSLYTQLCGSLRVDTSKARTLLEWHPVTDTLMQLQRVGRLYATQRNC